MTKAMPIKITELMVNKVNQLRKHYEGSPIIKISFQHTKREDFYTHYFIGVSAYVVILRHFGLKLTI